MSCKSALYTAMQTPTAVAVDGVIPLGSLIRRYGCDITLNGNAVNIVGKGYYDVDTSITVAPTAAARSRRRSTRTALPFPGQPLPPRALPALLLCWHSPRWCVRRAARPALR